MTTTIRSVLQDLERVQESLLALSEEIWDSIDHNNQEALEAGVAFKRQYNEKVIEFDQLSEQLRELVVSYTHMEEEEPEAVDDSDPENMEHIRLVEQLDEQMPHLLEENFRHKRPQGFRLEGKHHNGTRTWRRLYRSVLEVLEKRDPDRFPRLGDLPELQHESRRMDFSRDASELRTPMALGEGWFAEANLSANGIVKRIQLLLQAFQIPEESFVIYLREDRDAEPNHLAHADPSPANRVNFAPECAEKVAKHLGSGEPPRRVSGGRFACDIGHFSCSVTREYPGELFGFSFSPSKLDWLKKTEKAWIGFGCGSADLCFCIPRGLFEGFLPHFSVTNKPGGGMYWHVKIRKQDNAWVLLTEGDNPVIPITEYLV